MSAPPSATRSLRRACALVVGACAFACAWCAAVAQAAPILAPPQVLAGPSPDITSLGGMSIARDGSGGLVYLADVAGTAHVFVSSLTAGQFRAPQQLDTGQAFSGPSSQPVIAAGLGGELLVAFVSAGELYVIQRSSSTAPWQAPLAVHAGASNPAIQLSNLDDKAYLAYTAAQGGGSDVLVDYYDSGQWTAVQSPLNVVAGDRAGTGAGRPAVAAASDGIGVVAWGEGGHLYMRRVWGASPSVLAQQLDAAPASLPGYGSGYSEVSAGDAAVASGGDSSYPDVAFDETLSPTGGGPSQTRVMLARVVAASVTTPVAVDGLSVGSGSASQPAIAMNEYGRGLVTATQNQTDLLFGGQLGTNGALGALGRMDSLPNSALPYAAPGIAGLSSLLVAWQQTSASGAEIRLRYAQSPGNFGPEQVASQPLQGPAAAAAGLFTGGDGAGDAAVAWVQGAAGQRSIVAAQLFQPPGQPVPGASFAYSTSANPVVVWSPSHNAWGPVTYTVSLDGVTVAQTPSTSLRIPVALTDGPHRWQASAVNLGGGVTAGPTATVWVDTTPPHVQLTLGGRARTHAPVRLGVVASDPPNPAQPGARASGLAKIRIRWGDGHSRLVHRRASRSLHKYARAGLYRLVVSATDHAGNTTSIAHYLRIVR